MVRSKKVPVYSQDGAVIGEVSQSATSIGAAKLAGKQVQFTTRFKPYGWIVKEAVR